jgi:hypothetical protein
MTNGAAMLATAVALRPKRLIVVGVDLCSHPGGAYPDALDGQNDYAPAHEAGVEKAHMLWMLAKQIEQCGRGSLDVIGSLRDIAGLK